MSALPVWPDDISVLSFLILSFYALFEVLEEFEVGEGVVHAVLDHALEEIVPGFSVLPAMKRESQSAISLTCELIHNTMNIF